MYCTINGPTVPNLVLYCDVRVVIGAWMMRERAMAHWTADVEKLDNSAIASVVCLHLCNISLQ